MDIVGERGWTLDEQRRQREHNAARAAECININSGTERASRNGGQSQVSHSCRAPFRSSPAKSLNVLSREKASSFVIVSFTLFSAFFFFFVRSFDRCVFFLLLRRRLLLQVVYNEIGRVDSGLFGRCDSFE